MLNKKLLKIITLSTLILIIVFYKFLLTVSNKNLFTENYNIISPIFDESAPAAGDAKITHHNDLLYSYNGILKFKKYYHPASNNESLNEVIDINLDSEIKANWLAAISASSEIILVATSFSDNNLRIYGLAENEEYQIAKVSNISSISKDDDIDLQIDPAIVNIPTPIVTQKNNSSCNINNPEGVCNINSSKYAPYLLSVTKIKGAINSSDPNNIGNYKIVFYNSQDLRSWKEISKIEIPSHNLEDSKLYYDIKRGKVFILYEVEEYDKGPSEIHIAESSDYGHTWIDKTIINDRHDNEPVALEQFNDMTLLFFSSDKENPGKSYAGANGYILKLDNLNNPIGEAYKIPVGERVLLLDASNCGDVVGIRDYLDHDKKRLFLYSLAIDYIHN